MEYFSYDKERYSFSLLILWQVDFLLSTFRWICSSRYSYTRHIWDELLQLLCIEIGAMSLGLRVIHLSKISCFETFDLLLVVTWYLVSLVNLSYTWIFNLINKTSLFHIFDIVRDFVVQMIRISEFASVEYNEVFKSLIICYN